MMILIFSILLFGQLSNSSGKPDCQYSQLLDKKPGMEEVKSGFKAKSILKSFHEESNISQSNCFNLCKKSVKCQLAEYNNNYEICKLFDKPDKTSNTSFTSYVWKFCNFTEGYTTFNRCQGMWIFKLNSVISNDNFTNFSMKETVKNVLRCKNICLNVSICGGFNFNNKSRKCSIVESYNNDDYKYEYKKGYLAYTFRCADVQNYLLPNDSCEYPSNKCFGYFKLATKSDIIPKYALYIFKTRMYKECLTTCSVYENCKSVLFSVFNSTCVILTNDQKTCTKELVKEGSFKMFTHFVWSCCSSKQNLRLKYTLNGIINDKTNCTCIANIHNLYLKRFNCDTTYAKDRFSQENKCEIKKRNYSITKREMHHNYHCSVGQCYQMLKNWKTKNKIYILAYTGYETFVIMSESHDNMKYPPNNQFCKVYDATVIEEIVTIKSRKEWYAMDSLHKYEELLLPVPAIVIGNIRTKNCFCQTNISCESELRQIQQHYFLIKKDLIYNFVITYTGGIYEVLGWNKRTHFKFRNKNEKFIYIAFLGNYNDNLPSIKSTEAAKKLIYTGVKKGYIMDNYTLHPASEIRHREQKDARLLYNVISLWKNFRGLKKIECKIFDPVITGLNLAAFLVFYCLITISYKLMYFPSHSKWCHQVLEILRLHKNVSDIYCYSNKSTESFLSMSVDKSSVFSTIFAKNNIKLYIQFTAFYWLTSRCEIIQYKRHSRNCFKFIEKVIQFHQNSRRPLDLYNFNNFFITRNCAWRTILLLINSESVFDKNLVVICHFAPYVSSNTIKSVISKFYNKRCFCKNFIFEKINCSKIEKISMKRGSWKTLNREKFDKLIEENWQTFNGIPYKLET